MEKKTIIALAVANAIIVAFAVSSLVLNEWHVVPIGLLTAGMVYAILS